MAQMINLENNELEDHPLQATANLLHKIYAKNQNLDHCIYLYYKHREWQTEHPE